MPLSGVRNSWLMLARKALLARLFSSEISRRWFSVWNAMRLKRNTSHTARHSTRKEKPPT